MPNPTKPILTPRQPHPAAERIRTSSRDKYFIQSVDNALVLLETLSASDSGAQLSQLCSGTGLNKSTVFRLLLTFQRRGYVEQDTGSHRYRLSLAAFETARKCLLKMPLLNKVQPELDQMAQESRECVYLAVRHTQEFLLLELADPPQQIKVASMLGQRFPLTGTAAGKVFAACDKQAGCGNLLAEESASIRQQGYALMENDLADGIVSVATPLYDHQYRVPGVLLMVTPDFRLRSADQRATQIERLLTVAASISAKIGFFQKPPGSQRG